MSLTKYSKEEILEMSLIEVAYELLAERKQAIFFKDLIDELAEQLNLSEKDVKAKLAQFYTDLNIDGRFLCLGENQWGLRVWYPVDQVIEEIVNPVKAKKKKKAKKVVDEDLELDDFDDLEEEFDDPEDLDEDDLLLDDDDDDDDVDDDLLDDDLDETDDDFDDDLVAVDEVIDEDLVEDLDEEEFEIDEAEEDLNEEEDDLDDLEDDKK